MSSAPTIAADVTVTLDDAIARELVSGTGDVVRCERLLRNAVVRRGERVRGAFDDVGGGPPASQALV
jgi:hypothetical protein